MLIAYDTEVGNDVDDGFAFGVIHAIQNRNECELLAVTITKDHELISPVVEVLNTFYGRGDIPIGSMSNDPQPKQDKFL